MVQPAKPPALVAAFEQLHLRLKRLAATITGNWEDAEDTLQDAFLKLWSSKRDIASTDEAAALMTTTVRNLSIDQTRRHKTHPRDELLPNLALLRLRDYAGRDYEEIAELLQMTPSAVRVNLSRARKTVREVYRQRHQT